MKEVYELIQRRSLSFRAIDHHHCADNIFTALSGVGNLRRYFPIRGLAGRLGYCYHCKRTGSLAQRDWLSPFCEDTTCTISFNKASNTYRSLYINHAYPMAQWVSMLDLSTLPPLSCTQAIQLLKRCFPVSTWEALGNNLLLKLQTRTTGES